MILTSGPRAEEGGKGWVLSIPSAKANFDNNELRSLQNKIASLEMKIAGLGSTNINTSSNYVGNLSQKPQKIETKKEEVKPQMQARPVQNVNVGEKLETWPKIVNELKDAGKIMLYTNLMNSIARKENDLVIAIEFPKGLTPFGKTVLEKSENISEIERRISIECGKPMKIKYIDAKANDKAQVAKQNPIESFAEDNGIPFNLVE